MRKEILDALKAKFTGVSDAILGRIADKLAKTATTAEQVATAVEGVTFQQVLESYGDSRATEAQQTAVSNYEKKHGLKDGKQVKGGASAEHNDEPDNQHGNGDNDTPAWAKAIIDGQKSLSDRLAAIEGDKVTASRKQKFDAIIGKLPEDLRKPYARSRYGGRGTRQDCKCERCCFRQTGHRRRNKNHNERRQRGDGRGGAACRGRDEHRLNH